MSVNKENLMNHLHSNQVKSDKDSLHNSNESQNQNIDYNKWSYTHHMTIKNNGETDVDEISFDSNVNRPISNSQIDLQNSKLPLPWDYNSISNNQYFSHDLYHMDNFSHEQHVLSNTNFYSPYDYSNQHNHENYSQFSDFYVQPESYIHSQHIHQYQKSQNVSQNVSQNISHNISQNVSQNFSHDHNNWLTDLFNHQTTNQNNSSVKSMNSANTLNHDEILNKMKIEQQNSIINYDCCSQMNMFPMDNNNSFGLISNNSSTPEIQKYNNQNFKNKKEMDFYQDSSIKNHISKNCINPKNISLISNCSDLTTLNLKCAQTQNTYSGMNGNPTYSEYDEKNKGQEKNESNYIRDKQIYNITKTQDDLTLNKVEKGVNYDLQNEELKNQKNTFLGDNPNKVADIVNRILTPQRDNRLGDIIDLEDQFYKLNLENLNSNNFLQNYTSNSYAKQMDLTSYSDIAPSHYLINSTVQTPNNMSTQMNNDYLNNNLTMNDGTKLYSNGESGNSENNQHTRKGKFINHTQRNVISIPQTQQMSPISSITGHHIQNSNNMGNFMGNNTCFENNNNFINPKVNEIKQNSNNLGDKSNKLEAFRNNISAFVNFTLKDIQGWIVDFSRDQHGSRFIQQKMEKSTNGVDRDIVFKEITATDTVLYTLMTDVFGNYVVQKMLEYGNETQKCVISSHLKDRVLILTTQMYGCRVIQKAIECIPKHLQTELIHELDSHVLDCVKDQNGNHVIQKCIEYVSSENLDFIINEFHGRVFELSSHPYGCRVIQRLMEHCDAKQTHGLMIEIFDNLPSLVKDQYGNYVIQHILDHKKHNDFPTKIINYVFDNIFVLSAHKFASNVVEKCIQFSSFAQKEQLVKFIIKNSDGGCNDNLYMMMKDPFANYVVQKIVDSVNGDLRKQLLLKMKPYFLNLKKLTYGKHMINKVDRWLKETETMTCFFKCEEEFPSFNDSENAI